MVALGAVVVTVMVTGTVVVDEVNVTVDGLKLQVVSDGRLLHAADVRVADPVMPFCAVNVSVVGPDWPGLVTVIAGELSVIVNVGAPTTVSVTDAEDVP
jgi:hypothetical protein